MKTSIFQQNIGGTAAYMKRLMMAKKGCGQLKSNDTYFACGCFSVVKTDEEEMAAVVDYYETVKTKHKGLCLATLEKLINFFQEGHILL